jgi:outer membrane receptor for ferrienterochelin and colicins
VLNERQRWRSGALYDFADNTQANARVGATWTRDGRRAAATLSFSQLDHLSRSSQFDRPVRGTGDRQKQRLAQADLLYSQRVGVAALDVGAQLRDEHIATTDGRIAGGARSLTSAEPYAQVELTSARWSVVPGARLSWNEQWGSYASPRLAVRFRADSSVTLRASLGRGFRAPDFKELYLDFTNEGAAYGVKGNLDLRPEHSDNASLGAEWSGGALHGRAHGYWNELRDFIETRPLATTGGFTQYTYGNVDRATTRGAEAEFGVSLGAARAEAGYAYLYARDRTTGGALLGHPAHGARLLVGATLPAAVRSTATVVYTGRTPMTRDAAGAVTGTRDAFTRLDLRVARPLLARAELSLGVDNVFDARPSLWASPVGRQLYAGVTWRLRPAAR